MNLEPDTRFTLITTFIATTKPLTGLKTITCAKTHEIGKQVEPFF